MYAYDDDDWGEAEEDYSQTQWAADEWEASDEAYAYQDEDESQDQEREAAQESDEYDEDDQDNYE
jgi:hypothetical protein